MIDNLQHLKLEDILLHGHNQLRPFVLWDTARQLRPTSLRSQAAVSPALWKIPMACCTMKRATQKPDMEPFISQRSWNWCFPVADVYFNVTASNCYERLSKSHVAMTWYDIGMIQYV